MKMTSHAGDIPTDITTSTTTATTTTASSSKEPPAFDTMAAIRDALSKDYQDADVLLSATTATTPVVVSPCGSSQDDNIESSDNSDVASADSASATESETDEGSTTQVNYHDGATPLFLAIETTDWRRALAILQKDERNNSSNNNSNSNTKEEVAVVPQAKTWVCSLGTVETTFQWALWRRLPIHEACRRQAPAWLISALLQSFPASSRCVTQFGELPLHLAVECGAPPEVVNLLVAAHWLGICAQDQSGRTPIEILQDSEMLALEDHKVVFDSLTRSQETLEEIQLEHERLSVGMQQQHADGLVAIRQQHDEDLKLEQEQQEKLMQEVDRLNSLLATAKQTDETQEAKIAAFDTVETVWRGRNDTLQVQAVETKAALEQETDRVASLEQVIELKDHEISLLEERVHALSEDLQSVVAFQQNDMTHQVQGTEKKIHHMIASFVSLQNLVDEHTATMKGMLLEKGIEVPKEEEKKADTGSHDSYDDDYADADNLDDDFAMLSAAEAATSALRLS